MKSTVTLFAVTLALTLSFGAAAQNKRDYHVDVYDAGCKTCHDQGMKRFPSDEACLQCHSMDEVAQQTERHGEEARQNPHDSMHYGKEAPCQECHGEHTAKKALCQECHNFDYPKFK
ncbi:cytochrome c3 family protein [Ferrimonas sp.]|uniref:cytochrome c3 family protein n=1 Tax=Ferrimonas sp. TaxID=2080861 RepID=UPI003A904478